VSDKIIGSMILAMDSDGDIDQTLEAIKDNGGNTVLMFVEYGVGDCSKPNPVCPFLTVGRWNPYALVGMPGYPDVPQRELTQKDPAYWIKARKVLVKMEKLGLTPWFAFRDHGSEPQSGYARWHAAFFGNTKMFPGWNRPGYYTTSVEPAIGGGGIGPDLDVDFWWLAKWMIDLCYEVGITKAYGSPMNEAGWPEEAACTKAQQVRWFHSCCRSLRNLQYRVVGSIGYTLTHHDIMPSNGEGADYYDQHGIVRVSDIPGDIPNPSKVILNTDGGFAGAEGTGVSVFGKHDVSPAQCEALGKFIQDTGFAGGVFLSQKQITSRTGPWNMAVIDHAPLRALAVGMGWKPEPVWVTVRACLESKFLAGPWCPDVVDATYALGSEPTRVCGIHKEPEPPEPPAPPVVKPCSYFWKRHNYWHWLRCVLFKRH